MENSDVPNPVANDGVDGVPNAGVDDGVPKVDDGVPNAGVDDGVLKREDEDA